MNDPESDLASQVKQGNRNALVPFIELHRNQLLAFISRSLSDRLRTKVEPQDILQELTISAFSSFEDVQFEEREPFSWLCHLAERRIIDAHRKFFGAKKRSADREVGLMGRAGAGDTQRGGFIDVLVASITSPSQAFSRNQREFKLSQAIETLPKECRDALHLRYVEGLPTKSVAEKLGKSDGAVRVLLSRTVSRLQDILSEDDPGC